jgi:hypothetical protein
VKETARAARVPSKAGFPQQQAQVQPESDRVGGTARAAKVQLPVLVRDLEVEARSRFELLGCRILKAPVSARVQRWGMLKAPALVQEIRDLGKEQERRQLLEARFVRNCSCCPNRVSAVCSIEVEVGDCSRQRALQTAGVTDRWT